MSPPSTPPVVVVPGALSLGFRVEGLEPLLERIWRGCATVLAAMLTTFAATLGTKRPAFQMGTKNAGHKRHRSAQ